MKANDTTNIEIIKQLAQYAQSYFATLKIAHPGVYTAKELAANQFAKNKYDKIYYSTNNTPYYDTVTVEAGAFSASIQYSRIFDVLARFEQIERVGKDATKFEAADANGVIPTIIKHTILAAGKRGQLVRKSTKLIELQPNVYATEDYSRLVYNLGGVWFDRCSLSPSTIERDDFSAKVADDMANFVARNYEAASRGDMYFNELSIEIIKQLGHDVTPLLEANKRYEQEQRAIREAKQREQQAYLNAWQEENERRKKQRVVSIRKTMLDGGEIISAELIDVCHYFGVKLELSDYNALRKITRISATTITTAAKRRNSRYNVILDYYHECQKLLQQATEFNDINDNNTTTDEPQTTTNSVETAAPVESTTDDKNDEITPSESVDNNTTTDTTAPIEELEKIAPLLDDSDKLQAKIKALTRPRQFTADDIIDLMMLLDMTSMLSRYKVFIKTWINFVNFFALRHASKKFDFSADSAGCCINYNYRLSIKPADKRIIFGILNEVIKQSLATAKQLQAAASAPTAPPTAKEEPATTAAPESANVPNVANLANETDSPTSSKGAQPQIKRFKSLLPRRGAIDHRGKETAAATKLRSFTSMFATDGRGGIAESCIIANIPPPKMYLCGHCKRGKLGRFKPPNYVDGAINHPAVCNARNGPYLRCIAKIYPGAKLARGSPQQH